MVQPRTDSTANSQPELALEMATQDQATEAPDLLILRATALQSSAGSINILTHRAPNESIAISC
ncbi:hypothetical protein NITHO_460031 [Nitrolancea hollandica Lb]|uniref:Uncharacterized protein n=1 Tax=Nitrolancea hollandica Lb TaxID=1129897 RepID=I4EKI3_9BACT|nr:hypothetical protein NITHO_460031 [Nitrolancea hollandica Lb]